MCYLTCISDLRIGCYYLQLNRFVVDLTVEKLLEGLKTTVVHHNLFQFTVSCSSDRYFFINITGRFRLPVKFHFSEEIVFEVHACIIF